MANSRSPRKREGILTRGWKRGGAVLVAGLMTTGLGTGPAAAGHAGGWQTVHSEWGETVENFCDVAGLTVEDVGSGDTRFRIVLKGRQRLPYEKSHSLDTDIYINLANGRSASVVEKRHEQTLHVTDNRDGTLTMIVDVNAKKVYYDSQGNDIGRSRHALIMEQHWNHAGTPSDRDDDEFISFEFLWSTSRGAEFCPTVTPAIS